MCSSACQSIDSSSSSELMAGRTMFLMMTEWPLTPVTTSSESTPFVLQTLWMASETALSSMIWPSMIDSSGRFSKPRLTRLRLLALPSSSTILIELDPLSRPATLYFLPNSVVLLLLYGRGGQDLFYVSCSCDYRNGTETIFIAGL